MSSTEKPKNVSEEELMELAKKELLRDIKCASMRAEQFGAHSWAKPQKYLPSKRFLRHMLVSASRDNDRKNERRMSNKSSKITSAVLRQTQKHDHAGKKRASKKHSRWDSSPKQNEANLYHKSKDKGKRHHHHPARTKEKRHK